MYLSYMYFVCWWWCYCQLHVSLALQYKNIDSLLKDMCMSSLECTKTKSRLLLIWIFLSHPHVQGVKQSVWFVVSTNLARIGKHNESIKIGDASNPLAQPTSVTKGVFCWPRLLIEPMCFLLMCTTGKVMWERVVNGYVLYRALVILRRKKNFLHIHM